MSKSKVREYARQTLERAKLLKQASEKGLYFTDEMEKPVVEHQLNAAKRLAEVVILMEEAMESSVSDSLDETLRVSLSTALREAGDICSRQ